MTTTSPGGAATATSPRAGRPTEPPGGGSDGDRVGPLRPILWRLHFLGGFLAAPVALWLALTGIAIAWAPQIEDAVFGDESAATVDDGSPVSLESQVDAALAVYPDSRVTGVEPSSGPGETTGVKLAPADAAPGEFGAFGGGFTAYVDPVSGDVTGRVDDDERPLEWLRGWHSNFHLGTTAGTLTELAASWVLVSLVTGLYLWWPRSKAALRRTFRVDLKGLGRGGGRRPWRNLHSTLGVVLFVALTALVVTGLTWTEYAGDWVDRAKDQLSVESPSLQTELAGADEAAAGDDGGAHHGGGGEAAPPDLGDLDRVAGVADDAGLDHPYTISPAPDGQAWRVAEADTLWPIEETTIAVDPSSGDVVDQLEFSDNATVDQLTSLGIGFHQAELFGLANQVLLTIVAVAMIGLIVSGYVTWWRRRPSGALAVPPRAGPLLRTVPIALLVGFGVLLVLLPTLGVSFVAYLVLERIVRAVRPPRPALAAVAPTPAASAHDTDPRARARAGAGAESSATADEST
jgi:uncharacterized iron-regulated membrane protein